MPARLRKASPHTSFAKMKSLAFPRRARLRTVWSEAGHFVLDSTRILQFLTISSNIWGICFRQASWPATCVHFIWFRHGHTRQESPKPTAKPCTSDVCQNHLQIFGGHTPVLLRAGTKVGSRPRTSWCWGDREMLGILFNGDGYTPQIRFTENEWNWNPGRTVLLVLDPWNQAHNEPLVRSWSESKVAKAASIALLLRQTWQVAFPVFYSVIGCAMLTPPTIAPTCCFGCGCAQFTNIPYLRAKAHASEDLTCSMSKRTKWAGLSRTELLTTYHIAAAVNSVLLYPMRVSHSP